MTKEAYNQSIMRASNIIDLFTQENDKWSMKNIALACGIPTTTIVPILRALEMSGFLERDEESKLYRLGIKFVKKAQIVTMGIDLRDRAQKILRELSFSTNNNTHLAIMDNGEIVYIDRYDIVANSLVPSYIGKRVPSHCTALGKAMLAYMNPVDIERIIDVGTLAKYTSKTITDWDELLREFEIIRAQKYAIDDEEYQRGGYCIGVPIFDSNNKAVAAISISIAKTDENMKSIEDTISALKKAGKQISDNIG